MNFFLLSLVMITTLAVNLLGIQWGVPNRKKVRIIFGSDTFLKSLIPFMKETHREIREMIVYPGAEYSKDYDENRIIDIVHNGCDIPLTIGQINAMRTYLLRTYYPDEHVAFVDLSNINPGKKKFSARELVPGSFYLYSCAVWLGICDYLGFINITNNLDFYLTHPEEMGKIYVSIRIFLAIVMLCSVYILYRTVSTYWTQEIALCSSFLFGVSPVLNLWNHFGYYYGFALPFVMLSFLYGLKILNEGRLRYYVMAGIFSGLAMSVFIFYITTTVFIFCAGLIYFFINKKENLCMILKYIITGIAVSIGVFLLIHIFLLLDIETLSKMLKKPKLGKECEFSFQPFYYIFASLKSSTGWLFLLSAICGYFFSILSKKRKEDTFLVLSIIIPFLFFSSLSPWYVRRGIFLIPFMAIFAGMFLIWLKKKNRIIGSIVLSSVLFYTFFYSASYTKIFMEENIRDIAGKWINENIPEETKIGLLQMPAPYRTPPFQFYKYRLTPISWDKELLQKEKPEYFIISEYETLWQTKEQLNDFFSEYEILKYFKKPATLLGIKFTRTSLSAKDFWPPNPDIIIYRRKYVER